MKRANILGLTLGLVFGWSVTAYAQTVVKYKIDAANAVCWDQPHSSLAEANAMKVRVAYDTAPATDSALTCTGAASPFTCQLTTPIPMASQTVGIHLIVVEGANLDPIDGSYTSYAVVADFQVDLANAAQPPQKGGNGRIVKIAQSIADAFGRMWAWLT